MAQTLSGELERHQPIAIVRLKHLESALELSQALLAGGITALEFTLTNSRALEAITRVRQELAGQVMVGAGTILSAESAYQSIEAGAQFLVTPVFLPDVITLARAHGIPVICGAYSPTEIFSAWKAGANLIKVFPAGGPGPTYIKDLLGPFPELRLVPTGGVNLNNCAAFLAAGAYSVGLGSSLIDESPLPAPTYCQPETSRSAA